MIDAGTRVTFDVVGTTNLDLATTPEAVRGIVAGALTASFDTYTIDLTVPGMIANVLSFNWINTSYTAIVTLDTRTAYADVNDVGSIVANAFYQAVNALPTVTARDYGEPAPGPGITTTGPSATGVVSDLVTQIEAGLKQLLGDLTTTAVVLIAGIVVIAVVIGNGKNIAGLSRKLLP